MADIGQTALTAEGGDGKAGIKQKKQEALQQYISGMEEKVCRLEKELEERREKGEEDDEEGMGQVRTPTLFLCTFPLSPYFSTIFSSAPILQEQQ